MGLFIIIVLAILLAPVIGILLGGFFGATAYFFSTIFKIAFVIAIAGFMIGLGAIIISIATTNYPYILTALITLLLTVFYFKKKEIKNFYNQLENSLKNKVSKINENFILRTIIVILIVIILYLIILK